MTFGPPEGPLPELETTRVASGASARLVAVGVAGVLLAVVGFVIVNRQSAPTSPGPTAAPVAVVATPVPTPSPPRNQLEGNDGIFGWPVATQRPLEPSAPLMPNRSPVYSYAALMQITGGMLRDPLERAVAEVYNGSLVVDSSDVGEGVEIEVGRQWQQVGLTIFESFGAWDLDLSHLRRSKGGQVVLLVEHVPPDLTPAAPGPVAGGYTFTVLGRRDGTQLTLQFEFVYPAMSDAAYVGPRGPGLFNRCRWGNGPQGAPPRGNEDEADCLET